MKLLLALIGIALVIWACLSGPDESDAPSNPDSSGCMSGPGNH